MKVRTGLIPLALIATVAMTGGRDSAPSPGGTQYFVCSPDMALDRSGAVLIATNVESVLWKIGADDFSIKAQAIILQFGKSQ
jgi:hypothetical protein